MEKIINNKRFTIVTAITYTITLIIVSAPYTVEHLKYLGRENGVFEYSSNVGYVIAMIMALIMGLYLREKKVVAWITLFTLMLMRECNLHKLFTKRSMFGDGFYLSSEIPVIKKIIGAVICVGMIIFFSFYMYKYAKSFVLQYRKSPWGFSVLCAIVCVLMSIVVDKLVHRLVKKLHGSLQTCKMCIALEEGIELFIPIAFIIAMIQYFYTSKKTSHDTP